MLLVVCYDIAMYKMSEGFLACIQFLVCGWASCSVEKSVHGWETRVQGRKDLDKNSKISRIVRQKT